MTPENVIKVLVIDDSESMRLSLHRFLDVFSDLQWVGESTNGLDTIEECERLCPDVVLIDVAIPHVDVPQLTRSIRNRFPHTQVIGAAGFEEQATIDLILEAGAFLCVAKNANISLIADAVRQAAHASDSRDLVNRTG
jgi:DNA-binding NarL/FixJ family response regulator